MASVYVIGNFKGGVGKTKAVTMLAYESASVKKRKTLVIDLDPQANATTVLAKTGNLKEMNKNIYEGFLNGDLSNQITNITDNLDIISSNTAFRNLGSVLHNRFKDDEISQINYLKKLIEPLKTNYDAIYIDVPPTISDYSDNAMMAADYCIIVLQTQELSLDGAQTYIAYMQYLVDNYDAKLDVLGIIPCMLRPGTRVDNKILEQAKDLYGGNVLKTVVKYQERLKVYDVQGIQMNRNVNNSVDTWDKKAHQVFISILEELDEHEEALRKMKQGR